MDPEDPVEDVVQDTLKIATSSQKVGILDKKAWLAGIARNKILQFQREKVKRRKLSQNEDIQSSVQQPVTPVEVLISRERLDSIREAILSLPDNEADILRKKYLEGWNYSQICRDYGVNQDAVTNKLRVARASLRQAIVLL